MSGGAFIVLEGADAVGKQTQTEKLVERFKALGREVKLFSFHRYDTTLGRAIRAHLKEELLFLDADVTLDITEAGFRDGHPVGWKPERVSQWSDMIFQCMAVVDKYEGAAEIADLVESGGIAVCDRWWQSSYAYGSADGVSKEWLLKSHQFLPQAGLNIYLKLPRADARRRRPIPEDRYEKDEAQQAKVREMYEELWYDNRNDRRWAAISGVGTIDHVHSIIWQETRARFGRDLTENYAA